MYSAAMSPPRWPVPRPSSRSCERKRTCWRIFSASTDLMTACAAAGSDESVPAELYAADLCARDLCEKEKADKDKSSTTDKTTVFRIERVSVIWICVESFLACGPQANSLRLNRP